MQLSIGDFSRMTYLSVKALRHYHDLGLLEPADVDPHTGYRSYDTAQVPTAQVIRRFRELGMPVEQVKAVLNAPDLAERNALIASYLKRMESQLERICTSMTRSVTAPGSGYASSSSTSRRRTWPMCCASAASTRNSRGCNTRRVSSTLAS